MTNLDDIDIDINFVADNYVGVEHDQIDHYYDSEKFNATFTFNNKDLAIIHLNIHSLPRNFHYFESFLSSINRKFHVITFSETWLNEGRPLENILPEYIGFHSKRSASSTFGGGTAVYILKQYSPIELTELSSNNDHIECVFAKFVYSGETIVISSCYRKPGPVLANHFIESLAQKISTLNSNYKIIISGDFNFDLFRHESDSRVAYFLDTMLSNGLIQTITSATRRISQSLLDNFFISAPVAHNSGVLAWDISDHSPIFVILKDIFSTLNETTSIKYRLLNENSLNNFQSELSRYDFSEIINSSNLDFSIEKLDNMLMVTYNQCCPIMEKKISRKDKEKPWVTSHIKLLIHERQKKYRALGLNRISYEDYKQFRNHVNRQIILSKKNYFQKVFNDVKSNMKKNVESPQWSHKVNKK